MPLDKDKGKIWLTFSCVHASSKWLILKNLKPEVIMLNIDMIGEHLTICYHWIFFVFKGSFLSKLEFRINFSCLIWSELSFPVVDINLAANFRFLYVFQKISLLLFNLLIFVVIVQNDYQFTLPSCSIGIIQILGSKQ